MKTDPARPDKFRDRAIVFLLFFAISIFMFEVVFRGQLFGDNLKAGIFREQFHIATHFLKSLSFLWNPYFFCGFPLYADVNYYSLTSPLTILSLSLQYFFGLSSLVSFNLSSLFYPPLVSFFMYLYARSIGISRAGAIVSGAIIPLYIIHERPLILDESNTFVWFPLVLFFFEKAVSQKTIQWRYVIFTGLFYGIQFLGGYPQLSYYFSLLFLFYIAFRYFFRPKEERPKAYLFACVLVVAIAIGIFAIQLFPTYELAKQSARFYFRDYATSIGKGYLDKHHLKGMIIFDTDTLNTYVGIIPIFLALLPLIFKRKGKFYLFYLFTAVFFIIMISCSHITYILYHWLPYFAFFKKPLRAVCLFIFSISILAGLGMDKVRYRLIRLILIAEVFIFSVYYPWKLSCDEDFYLPDYTEARYLSVDRFFSKFRDTATSRLYLYPKAACLLKDNFYSFSGQSNLILLRSLEFSKASTEGIDRLRERLFLNFFLYPNYLRLTNTKYILLEKELGEEEDDVGYHRSLQEARDSFADNPLFEKIYEDDMLEGYEFKDPLPRAIFVTNSLYLKDKQEILGLLKQRSFDPKTNLILEEPFTKSIPNAAGPLEVNTRITDYLPTRLKISLKTNSPGFLVLFDTYYPGWKAYIDNNLTKIYRADYLFRAIYIDKPGVHTISFIYSPFSFRSGAAITLTTLICSIGGILWIGKRPQAENACSGNV